MVKLTRSELSTLILIIVLMFVSVATANMLIPSYGTVIEFYNIDKSMIGLPDAVFGGVAAIMALIWGYYTDRVDRSKIVIIGAIAWSIGTIMTAFDSIQAPKGFYLLILSRAITGGGIGCLIPIGSSVLGDVIPAEERASWFGIMAILSSLSNGIGQALSSFLGPISFMGWRFPFLLISLLSIGVIVMLFFVKFPERGTQEEDLQSLKELEMEYLYQLSKKDLIKILKKKTNLLFFIMGFISIIPGTLVIFFLTTMFSDATIGLFRILPSDIRLQVSTIMAGLVGVGYIVGNLVMSRVGDYLNKKNKRNRALFSALCTFIAVPACIAFLYLAPELDSSILPYTDGDMLSILLNIFKIYPQAIGYVVFAFLGSFLSTAGVSARNAVILDVNLPEHRGTISSLFSLSERIAGSLTLALSYVLLTIFSSYQQMIIFAAFFWLPAAFIWYLVSRTVLRDMNEKSIILKERTQMTFIDYIFEFEIKIDQALQYIFDFRRYLGRDNEKAAERLERAKSIFLGIDAMAKRKEIEELHLMVHKYNKNIVELDKLFKEILKNLEKNENFAKEQIRLLKTKIDVEWEPSDFHKLEILYDSGNLKVIEARLQRRYDLFKSIHLLKESCDIFSRVEVLARERLLDPDVKKLKDDEKEYQERIKDLIVKSLKAKLNTMELAEKLEFLLEEIIKSGISKEKLVEIIDRASEIQMPYSDVLIDLLPNKKAQHEIERLLNQIDKMFDEYDKWSNQ